MKKYIYNSLTHFHESIVRPEKGLYDYYKTYEAPSFKGLSIKEIEQNKYSYPVGVEQLKHLSDFSVDKPEWIKYFNSFDGYDIDIDRMHDGLDFLIDRRKHSKLPKTMEVYVNYAENGHIDYTALLNKTYAAIKIVDYLETLGVRVAMFACCYAELKVRGDKYALIEICVKDYADTVNMGALCASISPWMLRHWTFMWMCAKYPAIRKGLGYAQSIPQWEKAKGAIYIDNGQCKTQRSANDFISNIKVEKLSN